MNYSRVGSGSRGRRQGSSKNRVLIGTLHWAYPVVLGLCGLGSVLCLGLRVSIGVAIKGSSSSWVYPGFQAREYRRVRRARHA